MNLLYAAPTGHTLLLLDSTQSYHKEVKRTQGGEISVSVKKLLFRLRSEETEVFLSAKANSEIAWINKAAEHSNGNVAVIPWIADEIKGDKLKELF